LTEVRLFDEKSWYEKESETNWELSRLQREDQRLITSEYGEFNLSLLSSMLSKP